MKVVNRKFNREYEALDTFEVGIILNGAEVKSVWKEQIQLDDAFVKIVGNEAFLLNATIPLYQFAQGKGYDPKRTRKLLLHRKELLKMQVKMASGNLTMAPRSCYNKGPYIKLEIALVRGRKEIEKRKLEKKRDIEQNQKREMKEYLKT